MQSLSLAQARRIALAAQGFARPLPPSSRDRRHLRRVFRHTRLLQIDSVNVLQRAHYLPPFSRIGDYPAALLDAMTYRDHELFEYWGHEASLIPTSMHPLFRWRMRRAAEHFETWGGIARVGRDHPQLLEHLLDVLRDKGPLTAGEIAREEKRSRTDWGWNWSLEKTALEFLFWSGRVAAAQRRNFERVYDLPERVIPADVLGTPTPDEPAAQRELLLLAARSCGVATVGDLADYFRIRRPLARPLVDQLVEDGALEPVRVQGWTPPAYVVPSTPVPRSVDAAALLAPFDPLVWERERTHRLFGFRYRIEIYVPAGKRTHGYYVLPFLLGDRLVARVDLKADRKPRVLRVQAAWAEPDAPPHTADALADRLRALAGWLGLDDVRVARRGDLAAALAAAVASDSARPVSASRR